MVLEGVVETGAMESVPALRDGECQVWWAPVGAAMPGIELLDGNERERLEKLRRAVDRERFVTAHALLRTVAAAHLSGDLKPADVELVSHCPRCGLGDHGQPRIAGSSGLFVSLCHAGSWAGIAITRIGPVGLDLELVDALTPLASGDAKEVLSAGESEWWHRIPAAEKVATLAAVWTRKEAVLKAAGTGFQTDPQDLTLSSPGLEPRLLSWRGRHSAPPAVLADVTPDRAYAGSVVVFTDQAVTVSQHTR
jgi:4'-phosphopantetheinyl transferase